MSKPIDQELLPCPFCGCQVTFLMGREAYRIAGSHEKTCPFRDVDVVVDSREAWQARAAIQPAGVAVSDAAGAMVKIGADLCTVALREIENATDSPRLSRCRLENALAACKDRLGGYAIDLRCAAAPHPVSGEQKADELHRLDKQCRDDVARAMGMSPVGDGYPWSGLLAGIKILAAKKEAQAVSGREWYTCSGKGGEYELLGLAQGAGTLKGFNHMLYRNRDGVMLVREPEDFLSRMEKLPAAHRTQQGEQP